MSDARRPHRVTVVLLTYNCAHRLARVLDRLCELDAPILAVDNASTDNTVAKLRERPGIEVITLPLNTGAAGRNIGVQHARTPYVAFCDDDSWWEEGSLDLAANAMDACPKIALINARITVGPEGELDPISAEMEATPLPPVAGAPGLAVMGFMAGAVVVRVSAYRDVGGYQPRFFMGGEEETLAFPLLRGGWLLRYLPEVTSHHEPSLANAPWLRAHGMRNTLWNAWEHRRFWSALRWTRFVLTDAPKNGDWLAGCGSALAGMPDALRRRWRHKPMPKELDRALSTLDRRRFATRRPLLNRTDPVRQLRRPASPLRQ